MNNKVQKNYLYNLVYQLVVILSPLIITPYTARVLEVDGVGLNSGINAICSNFVLFAVLGTSTYAVKYIGEVQNDETTRSKRFWEIQIFRTLTTFLSILAYMLYVGRYSKNWIEYYIIYSIQLINVIVDVTWFFQGLEEFKSIVIRNISVRVVFIALVFLMVKGKNDLALFMVLSCLTTLAGNMLMWISLPRYLVRVKLTDLHPFSNSKSIVILFLPTIAIQIYTVLDKSILLAFAANTVENGYYEQSEKIVKMSMTIITSLSTVLMPRISSLYNNDKLDDVKYYMVNTYRMIWMIGLPLFCGLCVCADVLIPVFLGGGYDKSIVLIYILAPLILIIGFSNAISMQFLVPSNNERTFTVAAVIASLTNLVVDFILIPHFFSIGASIGTVLAEFVALTYEIKSVVSKGYFRVGDFFSGIKKYVVASLLMMLIVVLVKTHLTVTLWNLFLTVALGILSYFVCLYILKDDWVLYLIEKARGYKDAKR